MEKNQNFEAKRQMLKSMIRHLEKQGRLGQERNYIQHGTTTVFTHSVRVARLSFKIAKKLHLNMFPLNPILPRYKEI